MILLQERFERLKKKYPDLTEDIDLNKAFEEFAEARTVKTLADIIEKSLRRWEEEDKVELIKGFWDDKELARRVHAPNDVIFQRSLLMTITCLDQKYGLSLQEAVEAMKNRLDDIKQKILYHEVLEDWEVE